MDALGIAAQAIDDQAAQAQRTTQVAQGINNAWLRQTLNLRDVILYKETANALAKSVIATQSAVRQIGDTHMSAASEAASAALIAFARTAQQQ